MPLERLRRRYGIPSPTARWVRGPQNSSRGPHKYQNPSRAASQTPSTRPWLRFASGLPRLRQGLQPAENSRLRPGADLPETHPGCVSGAKKSLRRLSPGTTGRTGPTVGRMMQLRGGERRIRQQLQSKRPDLASPPAVRKKASRTQWRQRCSPSPPSAAGRLVQPRVRLRRGPQQPAPLVRERPPRALQHHERHPASLSRGLSWAECATCVSGGSRR